jgi:hypothetical protein
MGFVSGHLGWRWVFWVLTIINFVQFILYVLLGDETIYPMEGAPPIRSLGGFFNKFIPRRLDPRPLTAYSFIEPMLASKHPRVIVPILAQSIVFCYANIALIVEMPIAFGEKFNLNEQQIGLQFIAIIVGSLIGEQLAGPTSDWFLRVIDRKKGSHRPADRLWLSYIGFATVIAGLLVWGFQLDNASSTWNITPLIGAGISSFGNQVISTILMTFSVDSHRDLATDIGVCLSVYRQLYGFVSAILCQGQATILTSLPGGTFLFSGHVQYPEICWFSRRYVRSDCCFCSDPYSYYPIYGQGLRCRRSAMRIWNQ